MKETSTKIEVRNSEGKRQVKRALIPYHSSSITPNRKRSFYLQQEGVSTLLPSRRKEDFLFTQQQDFLFTQQRAQAIKKCHISVNERPSLP